MMPSLMNSVEFAQDPQSPALKLATGFWNLGWVELFHMFLFVCWLVSLVWFGLVWFGLVWLVWLVD